MTDASAPAQATAAQAGPSSIAAAALRAAEARARPRQPVSTSADAHRLDQDSSAFNPSRADLLPFYRLLDSELLPKVSKSQAVRTLETLHTVLSNILSPPNPAQALKYRQLRLSNKLINREIVSPANGAGRDFLVLCGFRREVRDFEESLVWKQGEEGKQLFKLRCGRKVIEDRIKLAKEAEERETRYRESEKEAEQARKAKALLGFEDDRLSRAERDERERLARQARAERSPPPVTVRPTSPMVPSPRAAPHHMVHARARAPGGGGEDDPPPAYGATFGRVLGTGEPPAGDAHVPSGVRMVSAQDMEDDADYDDDD
ncbi:hypothetical protein JCM10908_004299 [Rhodotorula pacifica]|uniref:uncharacterized protein n=1 Tax=Rhodotorula pacifica TaxID=1495444 RepID=UPI0031730897